MYPSNVYIIPVVLCLSLKSGAGFGRDDKGAHQGRKKKEKEAYDAKQQKRVKKFSLAASDRVLLRNSKKDGQKGGRLTADWTGPYTIQTVLPKGLCILVGSDGKQLKSIGHLKPYMERTPYDVTQRQPRTADVSTVNELATPARHGMICMLCCIC